LAADAARILKQDAQTNKKQINKHKTKWNPTALQQSGYSGVKVHQCLKHVYLLRSNLI
jgi:hypothetical protein